MKARGARFAIATAAAAALLTTMPTTLAQSGRTARAEHGAAAGPADWNTFSAEISLSRRQVRAGDEITPELPRTRYALERTLGPSGWRTTVTLVAMDRPVADSPLGPRPISNPFHIGRIEFDDSGAQPVAYDALGRVIPPPTPEQLEQWTKRARTERPDLVPALPLVPKTGPEERRQPGPPTRDWIEHLMPSPGRYMTRRQSVRQRFGHAVGTERGLERYLTSRGGVVHELLLNPEAAVPAEMNVLHGDQLHSHTAFSYGRDDAGRLVLKSVRVEERLEAPDDSRVVTDLEYSNVRLSFQGK
jgi:hypothetical protein